MFINESLIYSSLLHIEWYMICFEWIRFCLFVYVHLSLSIFRRADFYINSSLPISSWSGRSDEYLKKALTTWMALWMAGLMSGSIDCNKSQYFIVLGACNMFSFM